MLIIIFLAVALFVGLRLTIQNLYCLWPQYGTNYLNNEWIIVNKLAYKFHAPIRGDIVVFHPPVSSNRPFIKRIVGLPGETVEIKDGIVNIHKQMVLLLLCRSLTSKNRFTLITRVLSFRKTNIL